MNLLKRLCGIAGCLGIFTALSGGDFLWEGDTMVEEPVIFIADGSGAPPAGKLLARPTEILSAANSGGDVIYQEGVDFTVDYETGRVSLPPGSRIIAFNTSEFFPEAGAPHSYPQKRGDSGHNLFYREDSYLPDRQVRFTYRHADGDLPRPAGKAAGAMPKTAAKLAAGQPVKFFIFGDSIAVGGNASGAMNIPPFQPTQFQRFADYLRDHSDSEITSHNFSVGGMQAEWGVANLGGMTNSGLKPDFIILSWGVNDASANFSREKYADLIRRQMQGLREQFPEVEFLLVSSMISNPDWEYAGNAHMDYNDALREMADGNGVLVAEVTPVWQGIASRKDFMSLIVNGINHPNDFGHRIYADVIVDAARKSKLVD